MNFDWHNEKRRIKDLVPYVANPRQITEKQAKDLKASLERFGVADPLIINTDNTIIGGHQRKKILETLMGIDPDYEIDVRVPDRELSIDEMRELNVRLNKNQGEWNFDTLANNFELDDLLDWGFENADFGVVELDQNVDYSDEIISEQFMILIECETEVEQASLLQRFYEEGLNCRALLS
jgi:ParB-like chromosome segregation protein Spo0J